MVNKFAVVGGDLRITKLVNMLAKEKNIIYTYGLERAEEIKNVENVSFCENIEQATQNANIIIGPIPFSSDGKTINSPFDQNPISIEKLLYASHSKMLIAGSISSQVHDLAKQQNINLIDIMKREELAVLNTIATAEGAIQVAISNTDKILHGSNVLILGFGRVAKVLALKMSALSANVTCAARKLEDFAWMKAYGLNVTNINKLGENLSQYDIIINTVPHLIMTFEKLQYVHNDCVLIDLASKPGGFDEKALKNKNLNLIWALALPGKVAPATTAEFIKETIYNILNEARKEEKYVY